MSAAILGRAEGHFPQLSAPDAVNAAIRAYLDGDNLSASALCP
jgi:hypothetical protein